MSLNVNAADYDKIYKGKYIKGHEVHEFQPCGSKQSYWVSASSWVLSPLIFYYKQTTFKAYQPIYIEFRGHILDEVKGGFAENYDALIRISAVMKYAEEIPVECQ